VRLVVVENDPLLRKVIAEVLRRDGMQIIAEPSNGKDALKIIRQEHPDLILTDCDMPGGGGIELVQRLRASGDRTPVVMLSGQSEPGTIARATAAGVNRYLIKPVSAELLTMALKQTWFDVAA